MASSANRHYPFGEKEESLLGTVGSFPQVIWEEVSNLWYENQLGYKT